MYFTRTGRANRGVAIYVEDDLNRFTSRTVKTCINNKTLWVVVVVNGRERPVLE